MADVRAPHSALPCVHSTPLGRDVVPEVYCTEPCRHGSGSSLGRSAGSPSRLEKAFSFPGRRLVGASPPSARCPVTASHLMRLACAATVSASSGCVIAATALQLSAKYSNSAPAERVLVVTATAPSLAQANQRNSISGELSRCSRT